MYSFPILASRTAPEACHPSHRSFTLLGGLLAVLSLLWPLLLSPLPNLSLPPPVQAIPAEGDSPSDQEWRREQSSETSVSRDSKLEAGSPAPAPSDSAFLEQASALNTTQTAEAARVQGVQAQAIKEGYPSASYDTHSTGADEARAADQPAAQPETNSASTSGDTASGTEQAQAIRIPVLNYHSITVDPGNPATITPEQFQQHMTYLKDNSYTTLTLKQFTDIIEGKEYAPFKPVLLTFDDGYADNYEHALPILKALDLRATLFVSPGMAEDGYFLNWAQIKEMHQAGWDIQPHGMTHPHLPRLNAEEQAWQISEARKQIEAELGTAADVFCYPYGEWNASTLQALKEHRFRYAFTIKQGWTSAEQPAFQLARVFVNGEESFAQWLSKLEKW